MCVPASPPRTDDLMEAWWMTGSKNSLFWFVLAKGSAHGEPRLLKVAGTLKDSRSSKAGRAPHT